MDLPVVPLEAYPTEPPDSAADLPSAAEGQQAPILSSAPLMTPRREGEAVPTRPDSSEGAEVRATIGRRHNVDLTAVPIDRSDRGAAQASQMQARAFTSPAGVAIPARAGSLNAGEGESLLAHELTHVAQRVRYGPGLPAEDSPQGRVLEAEATAAEMAYAAPAPRVLPDPGRFEEPGPRDRDSLPLAARPGEIDEDALASTLMDRLSSSLIAPAPEGPFAPEVAPAGWSSWSPPAPAIQRADVATAPPPTDSPPSGGAAPSPQEPAQAPSPFSQRPSDQELHDLSHWLYPMISHRIKGELREGRERLGLITDHYRRW
jgi:hypothetical protein